MTKKILLLLTIVFLSTSCKNTTNEQTDSANTETIYYLIRHAEKDRNTNSLDPNLILKGLERSNYWANHFKDIELDEVYSTNYRRTIQTARPTAKTKGLEIKTYDSSNLYDSNFQKDTKGKTILIVGHSNTTPAFVNAIIGEEKYSDIADNDNGKLFIVHLKNGKAMVNIESHN